MPVSQLRQSNQRASDDGPELDDVVTVQEVNVPVVAAFQSDDGPAIAKDDDGSLDRRSVPWTKTPGARH